MTKWKSADQRCGERKDNTTHLNRRQHRKFYDVFIFLQQQRTSCTARFTRLHAKKAQLTTTRFRRTPVSSKARAPYNMICCLRIHERRTFFHRHLFSNVSRFRLRFTDASSNGGRAIRPSRERTPVPIIATKYLRCRVQSAQQNGRTENTARTRLRPKHKSQSRESNVRFDVDTAW